MENIKLSVIIPAYNAGKLIGRCLGSILDSIGLSKVKGKYIGSV